jgi:hypothetical protein
MDLGHHTHHLVAIVGRSRNVSTSAQDDASRAVSFGGGVGALWFPPEPNAQITKRPVPAAT